MIIFGIMLSHQVHAAPQERQLFLQAEEALRDGQRQTYLQLLARLGDYPLLPYLLQQDLEKRMSLDIAGEVRAFLQTYEGSPPAENLRRSWLRLLAEHQRWDSFLQDYRPQTDTNLQCLLGQAYLATGRHTEAMHQAAELWLSGESRPKSCDPLFKAWIQNSGLTRELAWQRIELAMAAGQTSLASYVGRFLSAPDKDWLDFWLAVDQNPELVLDKNWSGIKYDRPANIMDAVLIHGMRRLTRTDASRAAADWDQLRLRHGLDQERFAVIENNIALFMSLRFEPGALERVKSLPEHLLEDRVREWGVRAALRHQDWSAALHMLDILTPAQKQTSRWRYWRARALQETGRNKEAATLFQALATEQNYYGMLAMDRLGIELKLSHATITVSGAAMQQVKNLPGLQRAVELHALQRFGPARSEWQQAQTGLNAERLLAAARWAHQLGWHDRAIVAAASARHVTDLELRFPLPHKATIKAQTTAKDLCPAWVFGVMRQESLFMCDVSSSAGALGLMQIMPQTGKRIAGWHGENLSSPRLLLQPERNIRYGTTYLQRQLNDLQGHPALATAAYNAGQHRVRNWLPPSPLPADIWVETIPFNETRNYVEKVLTYTAVYEIRMGRTPTPLSARLPLVFPEHEPTQVAGSEGPGQTP
jgi:soluble lytic murein transglycosylase